MQHNATLPTITPQQERAIEALVSGDTVTSAAAAKVDRTTVYRWMRADYDFIAALNLARRYIIEASQARLLSLADKALTVVKESLDGGDPRTALTVLQRLGLLSPAPLGEVDPRRIERSAQEAQQREELQQQRLDLERRRTHADAQLDELLFPRIQT